MKLGLNATINFKRFTKTVEAGDNQQHSPLMHSIYMGESRLGQAEDRIR